MSTQVSGSGSSKRQLGGDKGKGPASDGSGGRKRSSKDERSNNMWWDQCDDAEFRKEFRIHRSTFHFICKELRPVHTTRDPKDSLHQLETHVAVCIWKLATGETSKVASEKFGLTQSVIGYYFHKVCGTISNHLKTKFIEWPNEESRVRIKTEFESVYKIPKVVGSLLTSHIPINNPPGLNSLGRYRNIERSIGPKAFYSIMVQGVVDHDGVFIDVDVGKPGKTPESKVFDESRLGDRLNAQGVWVVGCRSLPLIKGVLTMYTEDAIELTQDKRKFNIEIAKIRQIAVSSFKKLKGRWACLQKPLEVVREEEEFVARQEGASNVIEACCVLHNMCHDQKDQTDGHWIINEVITDTLPQPTYCMESLLHRDEIAEKFV